MMREGNWDEVSNLEIGGQGEIEVRCQGMLPIENRYQKLTQSDLAAIERNAAGVNNCHSI